jgi:phosphatidylserine/phosphatidylglycerophosphate/cardiolipin synthase-like enzyme
VRIRVLTNSLASNDAPRRHAGYARYRERCWRWAWRSTRCVRAGTAPSCSARHAAQGQGRARLVGSGAAAPSRDQSRASLHSKAVIIDGRLAVIGSMNLDLRSQLKNSEVALLIRSAALAQQATARWKRPSPTAPIGSKWTWVGN